MKPKKIRVGILGATGAVGQRFIQLLADHPYFEIGALTASDRSAGKRYVDAAKWLLRGGMPAAVEDMVLVPTEPDAIGGARARATMCGCSSLPSRAARPARWKPIWPRPGSPFARTHRRTAWMPMCRC